jgi:hypothetical protein
MPDSAQGIRALSEAIADLVVERQRLRDREAGHRELEANRLELAPCNISSPSRLSAVTVGSREPARPTSSRS